MVICRPTRTRRHGGMFVPSDPAVASALAAPKRPPGQRSIWLAELLERYGSYLIGALLPLYLNEQLGLPFTLSLRLTGYYLALGYAGGVLGGLVSDRFLGYRAATRLGGAVLAVGAALLASGRPGTLYPALLLLVLGSSCFKPALTAWLGSLYAADDAGQSAGFAWFYFAANIGAAAAPFVGGALRTRHGWPAAFSTTAAAFGLCLAVVIMGQLTVPAAPLPPPHQTEEERREKTPPDGSAPGPTRWVNVFCLLGILVLFASAHGQSGGALLFFARDAVDRRIFGRFIPPDFFASVPAAMVLLLTLLQQGVWQTLGRRRRVPSPMVTLTLGMLAAALAFGLLAAVAAVHAGSHGPPLLINALWIVAALTLLTVGEVLVIPVAMALVAQSAPPRRGALAQGLLCAALAVGFALAGEAGRFFARFGAARFFAGNALIPVFGVVLLWTCARLPQSRAAKTF